jgi:Fe-S-cluster-containing dehydrogenase component
MDRRNFVWNLVLGILSLPFAQWVPGRGVAKAAVERSGGVKRVGMGIQVDKCTFWYHRISQGLLPACVEVCPTQARIFGDLDSMASPLTRLRRMAKIHVLKAHLNTDPKVIYANLDGEVR